MGGLVHATKNGMWINEQIEALHQAKTISSKDYLSLWQSYWADPEFARIDFGGFGAYSGIKARFSDVLRSRGLYDDWIKIEQSIIPHSLFFTLIGLGHDVRVEIR